MELITAKKVFKEQALGWFVERKLKLWVYFFWQGWSLPDRITF